MKITITATADSVLQAKKLLKAGVDVLYIGESAFGLRLAISFTREELKEVVSLAHQVQAKVTVAANALMHPDKIKNVLEYLRFLEEILADQIVVSDPGVIFLLQKAGLNLPFIYEASTFVTSARQVNFWAQKGAIAAVLAREIPAKELFLMRDQFLIPTEMLVYGATVIQHSKRPLLQNYFNFIKINEDQSPARDWSLIEPQDPHSHYSIFEDDHGTHIFANNDLNLLLELEKLASWGYHYWKLEGLYTPEENFVKIVELFVKAKSMLKAGKWDLAKATLLDEAVRCYHPQNRGLDTGFFALEPEDI
ncbi:MAG: U32 family peptidase [Lactobacillales bacterium]|jgi:collagenase-like PrtC family protease|nr:U32 family peptidase [Lactobacillales bacterium]